MNSENKYERKKKRFAARVKSTNIICTNKNSPNIVLCNAGQATGLNKSFIDKLVFDLPISIKPPKLIAVKGESHSFLVFDSIEHSNLFYETYDGKAKINENVAPIFMTYVVNVPDVEVICPHKTPEGLYVLEDFINPNEEKSFIDVFHWTEDSTQNNLKNRQVKHYGYEFRYGSNDVDLSSPLPEKIPSECDFLWSRLKNYGFDLSDPDQLTVNKYMPGQGIPLHVDKHSPFDGTILSLSLGSPVVMDWKHHSGKYVPVPVAARSMLVMQGEARYDWQHSISSRTWDPVIINRTVPSDGQESVVKVITSDTVERRIRISLTFRWTRRGPCECSYKTLCNSATDNCGHIEESMALNLENLHVHQVYEQIAGHFSTTRHKPWPKVVEFMQQVPPGAIVFDLGCGNGKNILRRNDILQIGGERSVGLLEECREHVRGVSGADCVRADLLHAAFRDCCADFIICIAVVHHFSSPARRVQAIATISRLLRIGGRALITVWAKDQKKSNYLCKNRSPGMAQEQLVTISGVKLPVHENRTEFQHNDVLVPWKLRTVKQDRTLSAQPEDTLLRYYHVFEKGELDDLCRQLPLEIEQSFYEEGNWCIVCRKINATT